MSVILGHSYKHSFNAAIAATAVHVLKEQGHTIRFHDLCREHSNPVRPDMELVSDIPGKRLDSSPSAGNQGS
ncbi:MAG: NAD(P)H-dependent oxidoreductase [Akkermansia sp.]|nr:NAD(P)H-dependent oxidoreductase [Akkermansia sp.]